MSYDALFVVCSFVTININYAIDKNSLIPWILLECTFLLHICRVSARNLRNFRIFFRPQQNMWRRQWLGRVNVLLHSLYSRWKPPITPMAMSPTPHKTKPLCLVQNWWFQIQPWAALVSSDRLTIKRSSNSIYLSQTSSKAPKLSKPLKS